MDTESQNKSEATARMILEHYVHSIVADLADSVEAILLVGSLATHSYVPGPGDIDQITILQDSAPDEAIAAVSQYTEKAMQAFGKAVNLAPVVYLRSDLDRHWETNWDCNPETRHLVCVPEELLRIHDHAQIVYGRDFRIAELPMPTVEEMIAYQERWKSWQDECVRKHPEIQLADPMPLRIAVQILLSNATWHYYFATGQTCFNKHEVGKRLRGEVPGYIFQQCVDTATDIRKAGFRSVPDETVQSLRHSSTRLLEWKNRHAAGLVPIIQSEGTSDVSA